MAMALLFVIIAIVVCAFLWWVRGATTKFDPSRSGVPYAVNAMPTPVASSAQKPLASAQNEVAAMEAATYDGVMHQVSAPPANALDRPAVTLSEIGKGQCRVRGGEEELI